MEFMLVRFPEDRGVLLDGRMIGRTNETLEVEAGMHMITLDNPQDFMPESYLVSIDDTTVISPKEIVFMLKSERPVGDVALVTDG